MKILIASWTPRRREGGVAGVIHNLAAELQALGHQVDCLFREDILDPPVPSPRFEALAFAHRLARHIHGWPGKYDVVNLHAPAGCIYGVMRRLHGRRGSPPYVMTMHGLEERRVHAMSREDRKGRAWHFSWKNRLWHRLYHQTLFSLSIRTADLAILLNREAASWVQLHCHRDSSDVFYIPNGVESRFFLERAYPATIAPRLLYVGSWLDQRGIYYIADALLPLAVAFPALHFTVAGCFNPPDEVLRYFDPSLHSRIEVIPFVEAARMPAVYAAHDIFLFPSLVEGLPLALLEAMASGMPIITTETCGMPDVVSNGVNGLLITPADSTAIVDSVTRLAISATLRSSLGHAATGSMRNYTWDRVARRVEHVFALAAASQPPNRNS
jgi:glycosyltransferase involved in cell wall biosynthesis